MFGDIRLEIFFPEFKPELITFVLKNSTKSRSTAKEYGHSTLLISINSLEYLTNRKTDKNFGLNSTSCQLWDYLAPVGSSSFGSCFQTRDQVSSVFLVD